MIIGSIWCGYSSPSTTDIRWGEMKSFLSFLSLNRGNICGLINLNRFHAVTTKECSSLLFHIVQLD